MAPTFDDYFGDGLTIDKTKIDLFEGPKSSHREMAIDGKLEKIVDSWINGDECLTSAMRVVEEYMKMTDNQFEKKYYKDEDV